MKDELVYHGITESGVKIYLRGENLVFFDSGEAHGFEHDQDPGNPWQFGPPPRDGQVLELCFEGEADPWVITGKWQRRASHPKGGFWVTRLGTAIVFGRALVMWRNAPVPYRIPFLSGTALDAATKIDSGLVWVGGFGPVRFLVERGVVLEDLFCVALSMAHERGAACAWEAPVLIRKGEAEFFGRLHWDRNRLTTRRYISRRLDGSKPGWQKKITP